MADSILVKYEADLATYKAQIAELKKDNVVLTKQAQDFGAKAKQSGEQAAKGIADVNKQSASGTNIFSALGKQIAVAFSITAVVAFGKASVDAFIKAELSAKKLQTAVGAGGGLQRDYDVLLQQSKELQKTTIFNDETIQDAQTMALQFGLNAEAVKTLIPLIIDFASATGQDLGSALSTVLRGTTGQTRGLKVYGVEVDASATRTQKFTSIVQQLTDKFQGQGKIVGETVGGRLKQLGNAWDELKESIGGALAPLVSGAASLAKSLLSVTEVPLSGKLQQEQVNLELTTIKLSSLNLESKERVSIIKTLQSQYPQYLGNLDAEKVSNEELQIALKKVNDQLVLKIALAKGDEEIVSVQEKVADALLKTSKAEAILISQINNRLQKAPEEFKASLQGLTLDQQAIKIREAGLDVTGKIIESVDNRVTAENKLKAAQDELAKAQQKRIEEEERLRGILNIPAGAPETLSGGGDFGKKTEDEIKAEEAAAKKIAEAKEKAAKEAAEAVEKINEDNFKLAEDNLKKFQAEQINLIEGQNISREEKEKQFAQLELAVLNARRQNYIDYSKDIGDIDVQIANKTVDANKTKEKSDKEYFDALEKLRKKGLQDAIDSEDRRLKAEEDAAEKRDKLIQDSFDLSRELLDSLQSLFRAQTDGDIAEVERKRDAQVEAIDAEIEALEESNERGKISDKKFEQQKKALLAQRIAAEKAADEEQKKLQREAAEREKLLTIFTIGLELAEAIASLNFLQIIAATAQLAIAIATPIPAFKRGTKGKDKSGAGLVGEEGPEYMWIPQGAKILTAEKTKKHRELVDAMIDNNVEQYIYKSMIAPALREALKKQEKDRQKSFAENMANSFSYKNDLDEYGIGRALEKNNKAAAQMIAKAMSKYYKNNPNDRYYH